MNIQKIRLISDAEGVTQENYAAVSTQSSFHTATLNVETETLCFKEL
jgi:hypothetical protein